LFRISKFVFRIFSEKRHFMKCAPPNFTKITNQHGGALIEFAIALPLLLILLFGIVEFGLILYNKAVLTNASREGARYGMLERTPRYSQADISSNVVIPYCNSRLVTFGTLSDPTVTVTPLDGATDPGDDLEVQVAWNYNFLVFPNLSGLGLPNLLTLSGRTVMKYE